MELDDLLEKWVVLFPGSWDNIVSWSMPDWWAVANDKGIVAYFGNEKDALRFRLNEINRELNG